MSNGRESRVEGRGPEAAAPPEPMSGGAFWLLLLVFGLGGAILITLQARRSKPVNEFAGQPLPPLQAAGWLNSEKPVTNESLAGKIVLMDFWATWCPPCVRGIPELIDFHKKYRDVGVVVVGLTSENGAAAEHVKNLVETRDGMVWPIGYGAGPMFSMMGVEFLPTYVLFDRQGMSVWGGHSLDGIDDVLLPMLAERK